MWDGDEDVDPVIIEVLDHTKEDGQRMVNKFRVSNTKDFFQLQRYFPCRTNGEWRPDNLDVEVRLEAGRYYLFDRCKEQRIGDIELSYNPDLEDMKSCLVTFKFPDAPSGALNDAKHCCDAYDYHGILVQFLHWLEDIRTSLYRPNNIVTVGFFVWECASLKWFYFQKLGFRKVPLLTQYEFKRLPGNLSRGKELRVFIDRFVNPDFQLQDEWAQCGITPLERWEELKKLEQHFDQATSVPRISKAIVSLTKHEGLFKFVRTTALGKEEEIEAPSWSAFELPSGGHPGILAGLRTKFLTVMHMKLAEEEASTHTSHPTSYTVTFPQAKATCAATGER